MVVRLRARRLHSPEGSPLEVTVPQLGEKGGWAPLFGREGPLSVEIGVGKDPHLITRSERDPGGLYIGLEYSRKKLDRVISKALRRAVQNLRYLQADAVQVLDPLFESESIHEVFVFFPDPWPKKRHRKKRLIQPELVRVLAQKMAPGSTLELRTDDLDYRDQMLEVLARETVFENLLGGGAFETEPLEKDHIPTLFEMKFRERGKTIYYLHYRKRNGPSP